MGRGRPSLRRMAGRMGMDMKPLDDVTEVIIRTTQKELVITGPVINEMNTDTGVTFMVVTDGYEERELEKPSFSDEDVELICVRTGASREDAVAALTECDGELATAMVRLMS